jgi:hypothetical protein
MLAHTGVQGGAKHSLLIRVHGVERWDDAFSGSNRSNILINIDICL